jgi:hypothetical protein
MALPEPNEPSREGKAVESTVFSGKLKNLPDNYWRLLVMCTNLRGYLSQVAPDESVGFGIREQTRYTSYYLRRKPTVAIEHFGEMGVIDSNGPRQST